MAASPAASETCSPPATSSGPAIAPCLGRASITTNAASASSSPAPPTPGPTSSHLASAPAIAVRPGTTPRPTPINTSVAPGNKLSMASVLSPSPAAQLSMTSKEWVIPPRPKPGRKPATDTPPTKRKAQNRAAQRAFRERRAARVGELEEELAELKEEHKKREEELEEKVRHLELESETLRSRCQWLQSTLEKERLDRMRDDIRGAPVRPQDSGPGHLVSDQTPIQAQGTDPPVAPRPVAQPFSISHIISTPEEPTAVDDITCGSCGPNEPCICTTVINEEPMGCGKCTVESRCACLEALEAETVDTPDLKRPIRSSSPLSTFAQPDEKRQRLDVEPTTPMEIDFTAVFSQKKRTTAAKESVTQEATSISISAHVQPRDQPELSIEVKDSCGFCSDGGYCVCAEAPTMPTPVTSSLTSNSLTATAMPAQQQTHTPPPSDDDVISLTLPAPMEVTASGAIKLPPLNRQPPPLTTRSTCGPSGPGTCAQCIADPVSGLFCRSLAANFQRSSGGVGGGGGCCGGSSAAGGGCCKQQPQQQQQSPELHPGGTGGRPKLGLSLSCADAYKTLASHRHFDEAATQIGEWLPRLRAAPAHVAGRQPIEVEAASIMSVLKGFDVRFGRGE